MMVRMDLIWRWMEDEDDRKEGGGKRRGI